MNLRLMGGCLLMATISPLSVIAEPLSQGFTKAWAIYPETRVLDTRVSEVGAKARVTERLFFDVPKVGVGYRDDDLTGNTGKFLQEIFVELHLSAAYAHPSYTLKGPTMAWQKYQIPIIWNWSRVKTNYHSILLIATGDQATLRV